MLQRFSQHHEKKRRWIFSRTMVLGCASDSHHARAQTWTVPSCDIHTAHSADDLGISCLCPPISHTSTISLPSDKTRLGTRTGHRRPCLLMAPWSLLTPSHALSGQASLSMSSSHSLLPFRHDYRNGPEPPGIPMSSKPPSITRWLIAWNRSPRRPLWLSFRSLLPPAFLLAEHMIPHACFLRDGMAGDADILHTVGLRRYQQWKESRNRSQPDLPVLERARRCGKEP